ncbi:MAG TPA: class I SAM-dependent methyltransferase [Solirubrobacteraceae bacterium]|nr:class I SAM-dependent methyltransferase [Solirubrobacteraceae bacterium]
MIEPRDSYDRLAPEYRARVADELRFKPLERELLDSVAARSRGPIGDLGCGPGHVARYLADRGGQVVGLDLSPAMIDQARRLSPDLSFLVGDLRALPFDDGSLAAAVAMYSLIHFDADELTTACREIARVLAAAGVLLAAFHRGAETVHYDKLWNIPVSLDFHFHEPEPMAATLRSAGLTIEEIRERGPYPDVEAQTSRFYVLAVKRAS